MDRFLRCVSAGASSSRREFSINYSTLLVLRMIHSARRRLTATVRSKAGGSSGADLDIGQAPPRPTPRTADSPSTSNTGKSGYLPYSPSAEGVGNGRPGRHHFRHDPQRTSRPVHEQRSERPSEALKVRTYRERGSGGKSVSRNRGAPLPKNTRPAHQQKDLPS